MENQAEGMLRTRRERYCGGPGGKGLEIRGDRLSGRPGGETGEGLELGAGVEQKLFRKCLTSFMKL